jgi:glycosyltransferase involved in cell wall biosynthesis
MTGVTVSIEQRYSRTPDGKIWAPMFDYSFWSRYLGVFDSVNVVARVRDVIDIPYGMRRADGERVSFTAVPHYIGPWEYLVRARSVRRVLRNAIRPTDAVILRVDSQIAACLYPILRGTGRPYGVEVVVDPYDVFAPGSKHPLRPFFRWKFSSQLRQQCAGSCASAYVTKEALQKRYPPAPTAFTTYYSSVELTEASCVNAPRIIGEKTRKLTLITVAYLEDFRKGTDVLIDAVEQCVVNDFDIYLVIVGDGGQRLTLEERVARLGLQDRVQFLGQLPTEVVRAKLDEADLFVLPSRGEGLPRALIEAMARGLPAIGSTVGGFPEVLPYEDLVPAGNVQTLAQKIREVLSNPERMNIMAARNLKKANEYREEILCERRIMFYRVLMEKTELWLSAE